MPMKRLNLGSGSQLLEGYINVDFGNPKCDMTVDLMQLPWPWEDNSVDEVFSSHCFEHLPNLLGAMREVHRILKPGGTLILRVPHIRYPSTAIFCHVNYFDIGSFNPFDINIRKEADCGEPLFETISVRHGFREFGSWKRKVMEGLSNIRPWLWDWLGFPVCEVVYHARKP